MKVLITGGTGLIGTRLAQALTKRGDVPVVLSRDRARAKKALGEGVEVIEGNPAHEGKWTKTLSSCQAVVNLAGEPVFGRRWNDRQIERLRDSRIESTKHLVQAIAAAEPRPKVLVNASAIGFYGDAPEGEVNETSSSGDDVMARLCVDWEKAAEEVEAHGVRLVIVRIGVVLDRDGGAIKQMVTPFKLGVGGPVGSGKQWVSWIHLDDLVGVFLAALDNETFQGRINGTAPHPVRNKEFSQCLAAALHRPCFLPMPAFMLRLIYGEVAFLVITGQQVMPSRADELGFSFKHPTCQSAMQALFDNKTP